MAVPVRNYDQALRMMRHVQESLAPNIYAFLLFDDRPTHAAIEEFAAREFIWLDHLARSARIVVFVYVGQHVAHIGQQKDFEAKSEEEIRRERIALVQSKASIQNPSLEIARDFGIRPNQLPGIALLTRLSDEKAAIYFPLKSEAFEKDSREIEALLADLFTILQECQEDAASPDQLLSRLQSEIATLRRTQQMRPILQYAKETLLTLVTLPKTLPEVASKAFAQTFAQETARRLAGP